MKRVHFLGIGGSGASAAAAIAEAQGLPAGRQGFEVTGCDLEPNNECTLHIPCVKFKGHSLKHLASQAWPGSVDILAVTPAIFSLDPNNPELLEAKSKKIPIMTWQEFTGKYLMKNKFVIAVSGTHGKTTTTAMIAKILEDAGLDPTVLLGAIAPWWGTNYRIGKGKYFVIEADEYNDNFLSFNPGISVVTNIEMDHPEYFKDFESYKESFRKFLESTKKTTIANLKDPGVRDVIASVAKQSNTEIAYPHSSSVGPPSAPRNDGIIDYSKQLIDFHLRIPGEFNRWNASAAYQVGVSLGIDPQTIQKSLSNYKGISRRFEYLGDFRGAKVYSDFGHHPTEIKETMQAAREKFPRQRIVLIYEPHMFTRTKALFSDFVKVFKSIPVDKIVITDIYQSRETDKGLVTSQQLVDAMDSHTSMYLSKEDIKGMLEKHIQKGDIIFFMGAGDIDKLARQLLAI